ncbi:MULTISPECIES: type III secretion system export apparatus subunit SctR [Candidatus Ichthyocystis]|uniref:Type III secretion system protein R n=1 Tax=Candidatus Ichthyocystis hellenicum TaxID=1561003 RepID=A0A0S4LZT7_9BURK|nr:MULTISPECIES: type III secretion system export apparatus subunit SctR [Ichthyocystis]CUT17063.1 type III secretion system protein R [Candidatus Ichthyocystis hellenicum]
MGNDPLVLGLIFSALSLIPFLVVSSTSFLKISVVVNLVRNAIGVQQIPPNVVVYSLSLILSAYVMAPVATKIYDEVIVPGTSITRSYPQFLHAFRTSVEPVRHFLKVNSSPHQVLFFFSTAKRLWTKDAMGDTKKTDFIILIPAFMVTELVEAFKIGFLLYLPFLVIDLVISNLLLAMGMMMVSPVMISLPIKLLLFVMADGWTRVVHSLVVSYAQ